MKRHEIHKVTIQLTNIEVQVKEAIAGFNGSLGQL
jgi:3-hydroxyanthranilate 3,4-dioxygenase